MLVENWSWCLNPVCWQMSRLSVVTCLMQSQSNEAQTRHWLTCGAVFVLFVKFFSLCEFACFSFQYVVAVCMLGLYSFCCPCLWSAQSKRTWKVVCCPAATFTEPIRGKTKSERGFRGFGSWETKERWGEGRVKMAYCITTSRSSIPSQQNNLESCHKRFGNTSFYRPDHFLETNFYVTVNVCQLVYFTLITIISYHNPGSFSTAEHSNVSFISEF